MSGVAVEVDTIRLRGRVMNAASMMACRNIKATRVFESSRMEGKEDQDEHMTMVAGSDVLRSGARVGVDLANRGRPEAWVEFSAPKVGTGSNVAAMPLRQALEVARGVVDEASSLVEWCDPFEKMRVLRLDLDRDFQDIEHQGPLLAALAKVRVAYNPQTRLFPDSAKGGAVTLTRGPAARWLATLYSKHGEAIHRHRHALPMDKDRTAADVVAAEGRLRYELRLRPDAMGKALRLVDDLRDEDRLMRLARGHFDRVGYGLEVSGMQRAAQTVMAQEEWRVNARLSLVGWLFCEGQGMAPDLDRKNTRRYRDRARSLDLTAEDLLEMASTDVRLDYESGTMVAGAGA